MIFEVGKYYQHNSGRKISILGWIETHFYGRCLVGEETDACLVPVGDNEESTVNWREISKEEWAVPPNRVTDAIPALLDPATAYRARADLLFALLIALNAKSDATDLVQSLSEGYGYDSKYRAETEEKNGKRSDESDRSS